jgi:hypothetical protein
MNARVVCAGLAALMFLSCTAAQPDRNSYYYNKGERVGVVIAPQSVAVQFSVDASPDAIASVERAQVEPEYRLRSDPSEVYSPLRRNRTVVYSVPSTTRVTNLYLANLRDQLTRSVPRVTDVGRLVTTATGGPAVLTQRLSVGFVEGVSGLGDLRGLDIERHVSVLDSIGGRSLVVAYRVNADSELTPLEIANAIYEYRDPSGRQLVTYAVAALQFPAEMRTIPNQPHQPNDGMLFSQQWHLDGAPGDVDAPQAWDYARGSTSTTPGGCGVMGRIRIAVLDTGVEMNHPDLMANLSLDGMDYTTLPAGTDPNPTPMIDDNRHGTQAAGVAAACGDNGIGVSGVCPLCEILPLKINPWDALGIAFALRYAEQKGAHLVSASWGTVLTDELIDALDTVTGTNPDGPGIPVFVAMPEEPLDDRCATDSSGASNVIAVGGSSRNAIAGNVASSGSCIDLVAPTLYYLDLTGMIITTDFSESGSLYTADNSGFGGTSSATALAAGIAGLVLSLNPALTENDVRSILQHTATKISIAGGLMYDSNGFSPKAGYGQVNAHRAVVPVVKITTTAAATIQPDAPFNITVSASAPYLVSSIGWSRSRQSCDGTFNEWRTVLPNKAFHTETWSGLTLSEPGTYIFRPDAKDSKFPLTGDGYPHNASAASLQIPQVMITVQGTPAPCSGTSPPPPPTPARPTSLTAQ